MKHTLRVLTIVFVMGTLLFAMAFTVHGAERYTSLAYGVSFDIPQGWVLTRDDGFSGKSGGVDLDSDDGFISFFPDYLEEDITSAFTDPQSIGAKSLSSDQLERIVSVYFDEWEYEGYELIDIAGNTYVKANLIDEDLEAYFYIHNGMIYVYSGLNWEGGSSIPQLLTTAIYEDRSLYHSTQADLRFWVPGQWKHQLSDNKTIEDYMLGYRYKDDDGLEFIFYWYDLWAQTSSSLDRADMILDNNFQEGLRDKDYDVYSFVETGYVSDVYGIDYVTAQYKGVNPSTGKPSTVYKYISLSNGYQTIFEVIIPDGPNAQLQRDRFDSLVESAFYGESYFYDYAGGFGADSSDSSSDANGNGFGGVNPEDETSAYTPPKTDPHKLDDFTMKSNQEIEDMAYTIVGAIVALLALAIIVVVIVVIVVVSRKKKTTLQQGMPPYQQPYSPVQPVQPYTPAAPVQPYTPAAPVPPYNPAAPVPPYNPAAPVPPYNPAAPVPPYNPAAPVPPYNPAAPVPPVQPYTPAAPTAAPGVAYTPSHAQRPGTAHAAYRNVAPVAPVAPDLQAMPVAAEPVAQPAPAPAPEPPAQQDNDTTDLL